MDFQTGKADEYCQKQFCAKEQAAIRPVCLTSFKKIINCECVKHGKHKQTWQSHKKSQECLSSHSFLHERFSMRTVPCMYSEWV